MSGDLATRLDGHHDTSARGLRRGIYAVIFLAASGMSLPASAAPAGPCVALAVGDGVSTLDLYRGSIDAAEERAISAKEVTLCGLEEKPVHLRFHVHVE